MYHRQSKYVLKPNSVCTKTYLTLILKIMDKDTNHKQISYILYSKLVYTKESHNKYLVLEVENNNSRSKTERYFIFVFLVLKYLTDNTKKLH